MGGGGGGGGEGGRGVGGCLLYFYILVLGIQTSRSLIHVEVNIQTFVVLFGHTFTFTYS